jgi:O-antigen/teichoic acid export membrane protein
MAYLAFLPQMLRRHCEAEAQEDLAKSMIRDFLKDLLKYLPANVVPAILGFISIPILTRLFAPADYGNYSLVMATVSILAIVIGWLNTSIIRFHPAYERDGKLGVFYNGVIKLLLITTVVVAVVFLIVVVLLKSHMSTQLYNLMLIGALLFVLMASFQVLQQFLRARRQLYWYTGFSTWRSVAALGLGIALVMGFRFGVEGLLWGNALSLAVALPLLGRVSIGGKATLRARGLPESLTKEMAKYGFPLVVGNLAAWILSLSDRYVLEFFRGAHEVGIYSASYTVSEQSILLLASLFLLAAGPLSMNIWEKEGVAKSQEFISKTTRYYLIICLPAVVGLSVLAKPAIGVLTAAEYHEGYRIVALVMSGGFLLGLQQRFQAGLTFRKKTTHIMTATIMAGLLNLGLNFWLVPRFGYMAAAVTTLISYAFLLAVMVVVSRKYFVWDFPSKSLGKVALASAVMAAVVYPLGNWLTSSALVNLIVGVCIGVVVYFVVLFLLREPTKVETQELRAMGRKIFRIRRD